MSERLKHEGRLRQKELEVQRLRLRIHGLVDSIRDILDPFEKVEDLKVDIAAEQALELAGKHIEYRGLLSEIRAIKKALGD